MKIHTSDILFFTAVLCALFFALFGLVWVYWIALFTAYPLGLISFVLWRKLKKEPRKRNKAIPIILSIGLFASILTLLMLLIWN